MHALWQEFLKAPHGNQFGAIWGIIGTLIFVGYGMGGAALTEHPWEFDIYKERPKDAHSKLDYLGMGAIIGVVWPLFVAGFIVYAVWKVFEFLVTLPRTIWRLLQKIWALRSSASQVIQQTITDMFTELQPKDRFLEVGRPAVFGILTPSRDPYLEYGLREVDKIVPPDVLADLAETSGRTPADFVRVVYHELEQSGIAFFAEQPSMFSGQHDYDRDRIWPEMRDPVFRNAVSAMLPHGKFLPPDELDEWVFTLSRPHAPGSPNIALLK